MRAEVSEGGTAPLSGSRSLSEKRYGFRRGESSISTFCRGFTSRRPSILRPHARLHWLNQHANRPEDITVDRCTSRSRADQRVAICSPLQTPTKPPSPTSKNQSMEDGEGSACCELTGLSNNLTPEGRARTCNSVVGGRNPCDRVASRLKGVNIHVVGR